MRKNLFLILVFFALNESFAQPLWYEQNSGILTDLKDIHFVNYSVGYAVGINGKILKTSDGGNTWSLQSSGTSANFFDVEFENELVGWACGSNGTVVRTTNGGLNWTIKVILSNDEFHALHFFSTSSGFVAGKNLITGLGEIYYTTDGGVTFNGISVPAGMTNIQDIVFFDLNNGYVLDNYELHYTSNNGFLWSMVSVPTSYAMNRIEMFDATHGWISCDDGTMFYTATGGSGWMPQGTPATTPLYGISIFDLNRVFVAGQGGTLISTVDGGANWVASPAVVSSNLYGISAVDPSNVWTCGTQGRILRTDGDKDLALNNYNGPISACAGTPIPVTIEIKNGGMMPINSGTFSVLNGITEVLTSDYTGYLVPGGSELISLGYVTITDNAILTINYTGDDETANNSLIQPISLISDVAYGTNGPISTCAGATIELNAFGGNSYLWLNAGSDSLNATQIVQAIEPYYVVQITQTNCTVQDTVFVTYDSGCGTTAFSPNGDGVNDVFHIENLPVGKNVVRIYNRWGDEVAVIQDYDNVTVYWTGNTFDNSSLVEGTYYYAVENENGVATLKGWVQLIR